MQIKKTEIRERIRDVVSSLYELDDRLAELAEPLEKLRAMELLIDDHGLSIPRRIVAIHQLLMGQ